MSEKREKAPSRTGRILAAVLKKNLPTAVLLVFCLLSSIVFALLPPQILRHVIDDNLTKSVTAGLLRLSVFYILAVVLQALSEFGRGWLLTVLGEKYVHALRSEMSGKLRRLGISRILGESDGAVTSRFINDVDNVGSLVSDGIVGMITDLFKIIGIIVSMALFSWKLAVLLLVLVPALYALTRLFQRLTLSAQKRNLEQMGEMNAALADSISKARTIKLYSREKWMQDAYRDQLENNYRTNAAIYLFDASYSPIIQIIRALVITLITMMASSSWHFLSISVGMLAASIDLVSTLFEPVNSLGMEFQNIQKGFSGIARLDEFFALPEEKEKTAVLTQEQMHGSLIAEDVTFAYKERADILEHFSLDVSPGEHVTIAGRTGAGKTTLIGLLTGLLIPQQGTVTLGGVDISSVKNEQKRRIFGYVEQDFVPVSGSVYDQVTMKDPEVDKDSALAAIGLVGLIDELQALPDGLDTPYERAGLSQGQKMLLSIARAIAPDPAILIFDESTASLDTLTEKRIQEALEKSSKGGRAGERIVLSISHRLTNMSEGDRIVSL